MAVPTGFSGIAVCAIATLSVGAVLGMRRFRGREYFLESRGVPGAFEPFLQKYLRLSEFMVGLATGSIVLLSVPVRYTGRQIAFRGFCRSPLIELAGSIALALVFSAWLVLSYEKMAHGNKHTWWNYELSETLGISSLLLFVIGYASLVWVV